MNAQVAQLASEGHKTIAVVTLPSQFNRKTRRPSARRTTTPKAPSPEVYTDAPKRNITRAASAYARNLKADRRAAAADRRLERMV